MAGSVPPSTFVSLGAVLGPFVIVAIVCREGNVVQAPHSIADATTSHFPDVQFVLARFISEGEASPLPEPGRSVGFFEEDAQFVVASFCQSIDVVVAKPCIVGVSESPLVVGPALVEVDRVAGALLEHDPTVPAIDINFFVQPRNGNRGYTVISLFALGVRGWFADHHIRLFE